MSSFDEIRTRKGRSKGCPRCGATPNTGAVQIVLRELGPKGQIQGGSIVATKGRSFCEPCAVEVFQQMVGVLVPEESEVVA